jgi:flavin-dependent thymidylate synthase
MNNNTVELIGYYGSDETHAQSAWTSTSREITDDKRQRIPALLKKLASEGHHTPFEKSTFHFLVTCDIASHIHLLKHRIGVSINAESARYKELKEDNYYLPQDWAYIHELIDSFRGINLTDVETVAKWVTELQHHTEHGNYLYHKALEELAPILGRNRAKESARFFRSYNTQIVTDVSFNWRSFYHFYNLRAKPDAQKEIASLAREMLSNIKLIPDQPFKHTIEAFGL